MKRITGLCQSPPLGDESRGFSRRAGVYNDFDTALERSRYSHVCGAERATIVCIE